MLFTTSWDDGYALDLELRDALKKRNLTGTFYVCPTPQHGRTMLGSAEIKLIASDCEVGSHTLTHPTLTEIPHDRARREIGDSKHWVEDITGKPCTMFCYPRGAVNRAVAQYVKDAGYEGARTCELLRFQTQDAFHLPVSVQVSPFPFRTSFRPPWKILDPLGPLRARLPRLHQLSVPLRACRNWLSYATWLFDWALRKNQPFFHLYGHSHEIDKAGMWDDLARFLDHVQNTKPHSEPVTNGELISRLRLP